MHPDTPSARILRDGARADLAMTLGSWAHRQWQTLPPMQRAEIEYILAGRPFADRDVLVAVPLRWLAEGVQAARKSHPKTP